VSRSRVNVWVLVVGLLITAPFVYVLASGFGKDPHAVPSVLEGKPAPDFSLVDMDGNPVALSSLAGSPVVLNFWSTWCQPCKIEHPLLQQAPAVFPDVKFYGIIYADQTPAVRRFLDQSGQRYPHLVDPGGRTALDYGVAGVPETFFIDRYGQIVAKHVGPLSPDSLRYAVDLTRASAPPKSTP
jgi:cytochrome c biogenesis protein CcmG/thiol:disulfide interchange protein DsbE